MCPHGYMYICSTCNLLRITMICYIYVYIYVTGKACNQAFHEILENFSQFSEMTNSIKHFMVTEICRFFMK